MIDQNINNWGRWGENDQRGMLNLQTPASILRALKLVKKGKTYNLSVRLEAEGPQHPMFHKTWQTTFMTTHADPCGFQVADDVLTMVTHSGTHMDALGHCWTDGQLWNGRSTDNVTSYGIEWAGIENVSEFVTRGVMLDIARYKKVDHLELGEVITTEDMQGCADAQGVEVQPGDVLLLRTGWYTVFNNNYELWKQGEPGPDATCAGWLKEKDVMMLGADNAGVESYKLGGGPYLDARLHLATLRDLGIYLIEHLDLEELAKDEVYEFLFIAAPLRLPKATGSPLTPLSII